MIKIKIPDGKEGYVHETLTRLGITNTRTQEIFPSCYLINDNGEYKVAHFKELFVLINDGATVDMADEDYTRLNTIVRLLDQWGLATPSNDVDYSDTCYIDIIKKENKQRWTVSHKIKLKKLSELGFLTPVVCQ